MSIHEFGSKPGATTPARVLIVDSDDHNRQLALRVLQPLARRYALVEVDSARAWNTATQHEDIAAVICAYQLAWSDGLSVLHTMRLLYPECVTVLAGTTDALQVRSALSSGAVDDIVSNTAQGWVSLLRTLSRRLLAADEAPSTEVPVPPREPVEVESLAKEHAPVAKAVPPQATSAQPSPQPDAPPQGSWSTSNAAISHDMRDWVQLIGHRANALTSHDSLVNDAAAQHHLQRILANVSRLQDVLDDVFSPDKPRADDNDTVELDSVIAEIADHLCLAEPKIKVEIDFRGLPAVAGQRTSLYRLFDNLIRNSIRHAEQSPVRIRLRATLSAEAHLISVSDNGPGIATEQLENVFEAHFRAPESRLKPGSGIGLTTCREIVKSLGGAIWIESPRRRGITVYIRLPVQKQGRYAEGDV